PRLEAPAQRSRCIELAGRESVSGCATTFHPRAGLHLRVRTPRRPGPCVVEADAGRRLDAAALGRRPAAAPFPLSLRLAAARAREPPLTGGRGTCTTTPRNRCESAIIVTRPRPRLGERRKPGSSAPDAHRSTTSCGRTRIGEDLDDGIERARQ